MAAGSGGNNRPFYSYVKQKTKSRPSIGPLKHEGVSVTDNKEMATLLNKCFGDSFTREDSSNIPEPEPMEMGGFLYNINITVAAVRKKINSLRSKSESGSRVPRPNGSCACRLEMPLRGHLDRPAQPAVEEIVAFFGCYSGCCSLHPFYPYPHLRCCAA